MAIAIVKGLAGPLAMVFLLPLIIGNDGLWYSTPAAEILALLTAIGFFAWWAKKGERKALAEAQAESE